LLFLKEIGEAPYIQRANVAIAQRFFDPADRYEYDE
jgi:hypothetical protein